MGKLDPPQILQRLTAGIGEGIGLGELSLDDKRVLEREALVRGEGAVASVVADLGDLTAEQAIVYESHPFEDTVKGLGKTPKTETAALQDLKDRIAAENALDTAGDNSKLPYELGELQDRLNRGVNETAHPAPSPEIPVVRDDPETVVEREPSPEWPPPVRRHDTVEQSKPASPPRESLVSDESPVNVSEQVVPHDPLIPASLLRHVLDHSESLRRDLLGLSGRETDRVIDVATLEPAPEQVPKRSLPNVEPGEVKSHVSVTLDETADDVAPDFTLALDADQPASDDEREVSKPKNRRKLGALLLTGALGVAGIAWLRSSSSDEPSSLATLAPNSAAPAPSVETNPPITTPATTYPATTKPPETAAPAQESQLTKIPGFVPAHIAGQKDLLTGIITNDLENYIKDGKGKNYPLGFDRDGNLKTREDSFRDVRLPMIIEMVVKEKGLDKKYGIMGVPSDLAKLYSEDLKAYGIKNYDFADEYQSSLAGVKHLEQSVLKAQIDNKAEVSAAADDTKRREILVRATVLNYFSTLSNKDTLAEAALAYDFKWTTSLAS